MKATFYLNQSAIPNIPQATCDPKYPLPNLQIRPYTRKIIPAVLDLTRIALGNNGAVQKTEAFWHWKHEANPFGTSYGLYAWDEHQQTVAGLRVLMRWCFHSSDGQQFQAVRAVDTATHPSYQRRGIFSNLTRQAVSELTNEGVHLIFNTPNQRSLPGYLKMGWQIVEKWSLCVKVLKPVRLLRRLVRRQPLIPARSQFEHYFGPEVFSWTTFVKRYRHEIPELISMWEKERKQIGLRTRRNLAYLQWRYGQHPHLQYGCYPLEDAGELAGFAILRPNWRNGLQEIVLTEIFLKVVDRGLGRSLLKGLFKQLNGDYLVAHFAAGSFERKLLRRVGFLGVPRQGMIFTVRPLNVSPQVVLPATAWDLSLGDLELF